ncbi:excalibur calcium-binding domain-containing protein [Priestia aryabhattai]|uniref:excalibur calcium-binding domain-containing protein n=1 Tax=Priestia aryabhattai TaxID=412384 RepID=UPI003CF9F428
MFIAVIGVLLFFAFVICLIWGIVNLVRKKKAKKIFLISLTSLVLCFVLALVDSSNDEEQAAEKEAQMQKEREARIEKKTATTASATVKPTFKFVEAAGIIYKMVGETRSADVDMTKAKFIKTSVMKGYLTTKMKDHVYMYADVDKSGEWIQATFDDKDNVVKKVEMSPNLEKKVVASVDKEKATETAKKEEAQKKQEEQKAKEEAQAKAAEEKRKQEEAARVAEEKRVAEQKQKEQEALQAKQQAEAEQARKEAEEKAQAEAQAQQQQQQTQTVYFKNCTEARAAGAAPVYQGQPGYAKHLDRDGDGVGCDQ